MIDQDTDRIRIARQHFHDDQVLSRVDRDEAVTEDPLHLAVRIEALIGRETILIATVVERHFHEMKFFDIPRNCRLRHRIAGAVELIDELVLCLDWKNVADELKSMTNREEHLQELSDRLAQLEQKVRTSGLALSAARKQAATELEKAIQRELKELYMEKTQFEVRFKEGPFKADGLDQVEFYMMTNVGEPFKPLAKVASGGELSRVMLALKSIFSRTVGVASIIFDEVDTGVSGRVAQAMGEKIFRLSVGSQVLCITHLAQVAAMADQHLYITKTETDDRTKTNVSTLGHAERVDELGRMIAGAQMTDLTKQHVEELLTMSLQLKRKFIEGVS